MSMLCLKLLITAILTFDVLNVVLCDEDVVEEKRSWHSMRWEINAYSYDYFKYAETRVSFASKSLIFKDIPNVEWFLTIFPNGNVSPNTFALYLECDTFNDINIQSVNIDFIFEIDVFNYSILHENI